MSSECRAGVAVGWYGLVMERRLGRVRSVGMSEGSGLVWPVAGGVWGRGRAGLRVAGVLAFTLVAAVVQVVCLVVPGRAKVRFARVYWAGMSG